MEKPKLCVQKKDWQALRKRVHEIAPELAKIIEAGLEQLPVEDRYFYLVSYRYGNTIIRNGQFHVPTDDGKTIALSEVSDDALRRDLAYSSLPVGLTMNRCIEIFAEIGRRCVPLRVLNFGNVIGLWEFFDPKPEHLAEDIWSISAGVRTAFMLPKISDNKYHRMLMHNAQVKSAVPKRMLGHYYIFRDIAKTRAPEWRCDIMIFPKQWMCAPLPQKIETYFLREAWRQSLSCRMQMSANLTWEHFANDVTRRDWKPKPATINIIKHLLSIASGMFPGFAPAQDESALPVDAIRQAYVKDYKLPYTPIVMRPVHFGDDIASVYYSVALATLPESLIKSRNAPRPIIEMREIKRLIDLMENHGLGKGCRYTCYHCEPDKTRNIFKVAHILEDDPVIAAQVQQLRGAFPLHAPFFRGVIRISRR